DLLVDGDRRRALLRAFRAMRVVGLEPAALRDARDVADVDHLVLDLEHVPEATQLRNPLVERRLAALEPGRDRSAGAGLLALRAPARGLALAGGDAPPDAPLRLVRAGCRPEVVELHLDSSVGAAGSSTVTRKRTWRTMPRVASLAGSSTLEPMPCSPRARSVARLRAMGLMELLTCVTRKVAAAALADIGPLRGLTGDPRPDGHAAARAELGRRSEAAQALERGAGHVDGIRRAVDLRQDVANAGRLHDGAHRAAGDDARALAGGLEHDDAGGVDRPQLVRDRRPDHRDPDQVLLGVLDALADRLGNLAGLAEADADVAGA